MYVGFGTICDFRHPLGDLGTYPPCIKGRPLHFFCLGCFISEIKLDLVLESWRSKFMAIVSPWNKWAGYFSKHSSLWSGSSHCHRFSPSTNSSRTKSQRTPGKAARIVSSLALPLRSVPAGDELTSSGARSFSASAPWLRGLESVLLLGAVCASEDA